MGTGPALPAAVGGLLANFTRKPKTQRGQDHRREDTPRLVRQLPDLGFCHHGSQPSADQVVFITELGKLYPAPTMNLYSVVNSVSLISMYLFPFLITLAFPSRIYN